MAAAISSRERDAAAFVAFLRGKPSSHCGATQIWIAPCWEIRPRKGDRIQWSPLPLLLPPSNLSPIFPSWHFPYLITPSFCLPQPALLLARGKTICSGGCRPLTGAGKLAQTFPLVPQFSVLPQNVLWHICDRACICPGGSSFRIAL